jgi:short-subunit dehydrogenase
MLSHRYSTAFITGASSGIGRAITEMLLTEGLRVWGTARDTARLANLARKHPATFFPVALDLDNPDAAQTAFENASAAASSVTVAAAPSSAAAASSSATASSSSALSATASPSGAFGIVINNAGYGAFAPFASADFALWRTQIEAMLVTTARLAHAAFRSMQACNHGCLVNVSSLAVDFPLPYMSGYNIAKAGLSALSASLAFEARGTRVCVIDFRPGDYRTAFNHVMKPAPGNGENGSGENRSGGNESRENESGHSPRVASAWKTIDAQFNAAPLPVRAARDLRRALVRGRPGTVRSGSFFQARLAPLGARLLPAQLLRALAARYFGVP